MDIFYHSSFKCPAQILLFIHLSIAVYDNDDYLDEEETDATEMSLGQMLESHVTSESEFCDDAYEYE